VTQEFVEFREIKEFENRRGVAEPICQISTAGVIAHHQWVPWREPEEDEGSA
jgi:hypothetical protein